NHNYVSTEHLLLGLLRDQDCMAAQVLMNLGLKLEDVREQVLNLLGRDLECGESKSSAVVPAAEEMDLSKLPVETQQAVRELDGEINKLTQDKEAAIAEQDFETAARFRDRAYRLEKKRQTLI